MITSVSPRMTSNVTPASTVNNRPSAAANWTTRSFTDKTTSLWAAFTPSFYGKGGNSGHTPPAQIARRFAPLPFGAAVPASDRLAEPPAALVDQLREALLLQILVTQHGPRGHSAGNRTQRDDALDRATALRTGS